MAVQTFEHLELKIKECSNVKISHSFMPYFVVLANSQDSTKKITNFIYSVPKYDLPDVSACTVRCDACTYELLVAIL